MFDVETILAECPPFAITLEISGRETELDIVPHWINGENFCCFYVFQSGKELGIVISSDINEWDWLTYPRLKWLARLIGNEIDWHYL